MQGPSRFSCESPPGGSTRTTPAFGKSVPAGGPTKKPAVLPRAIVISGCLNGFSPLPAAFVAEDRLQVAGPDPVAELPELLRVARQSVVQVLRLRQQRQPLDPAHTVP